MVVRINTFNRRTNLVVTKNFESLVSELADNHGQSVFFCNVHMLMLAQEDLGLQMEKPVPQQKW